jgi:hypothetical protein
LTDTLPAHLTASSGGGWECSGGTPEVCTSSVPSVPAGYATQDAVTLAVSVTGGSGPVEENQVTIAGGGAGAAASASDRVTVSETPAGFGIAGWDGWFTNANGLPDTLAGSHPYEATFAIAMNTILKEGTIFKAGGELRDIEVGLPPGMIADPDATQSLCTREELDDILTGPTCPAASQIGVIKGALQAGPGLPTEFKFNVYNMVPPAGVPAQFGFAILGVNAYIDGGVRSGSDYGLVGRSDDLPNRKIDHAIVTLWGVPAEASHDPDRCTVLAGKEICGLESGAPPEAFLRMPTSCGGPLTTTLHATAWQEGPAPEEASASFETRDPNGTPVGVTGCEDLAFGPAISIAPASSETDVPAGLTAEVRVPQEGLTAPEGTAGADIKETTVTLPEGLVVDPAQAAGLTACQPSQTGVGSEAPPTCPATSKVGTVSVKTPLLEGAAEKELTGSVYVLQSNPPNLQLLAAFSGDGVNVKLILNAHLNETTGQLTTTVSSGIPAYPNIPPFPISDFKLTFDNGAQAALVTPSTCGTYTSSTLFTPWSAPPAASILDASSFALTNNGSCPATLPFAASLSAGSTSSEAGAFTGFDLQLQAPPGQQRLAGLQLTMPQGLAAILAKVPLCGELEANEGTCPAASLIGHASAAAGPGPLPLVIPQPGEPAPAVYLTGPYHGAPFGLSIVTQLLAGPFNLGVNIVRATIAINPRTAQVTVTTDPAASPHALPTILDGVPTDLRILQTTISRPEFMINPTNCTPSSFTGTAVSTQGASTPLAARFQVGACQALKFTPKITFSTNGKTSKADGASLTATVTYPKAPQGTQANITYTKVTIPKQLPSRLTTLQKACLAKVFETNPAACPPASIIGHATVTTPVLPVPLTGPAYFVSHGGEEFPTLTIILQGDNVTIELTANTLIHKGITTSTFKTVPDAPFNTFTLTFPQGPYSVFAANTNLCTTKLTIPTTFIAQNGQQTTQNTPLTTTNCPKKHKHPKKHTKKHK